MKSVFSILIFGLAFMALAVSSATAQFNIDPCDGSFRQVGRHDVPRRVEPADPSNATKRDPRESRGSDSVEISDSYYIAQIVNFVSSGNEAGLRAFIASNRLRLRALKNNILSAVQAFESTELVRILESEL